MNSPQRTALALLLAATQALLPLSAQAADYQYRRKVSDFPVNAGQLPPKPTPPSGEPTPEPTPAPAVSLSTTLLNFGSLNVGATSQAQGVLVTNVGNATLSLPAGGVTSSGSSFNAGTNCPTSLAPGASCTVQGSFFPDTEGPKTGYIDIVSDAQGAPHRVNMVGTGLQAMLSANAPTFADTTIASTSAAVNATLTNSGTYAATITSVSSSSAEFTVVNAAACTSSALQPGASCNVSLSFTPSVAGTRTSVLTVASNAGNPALSVNLSAVGLVPVDTSVAAFLTMDGPLGSAISASAEATGKLVTKRGTPAVYNSTAVFGQSALFTTASTGGAGSCGVLPTTSLEVARSPDFEFDTANFTLEMRVRPSALGGTQGLLSFYESCAGGGGNIKGWLLYVSGTKVVFNRGNGADQPFAFATNLANNTFHHLALVKTGSTVSLYVNGVKDANVMTLTGTYLPTNSNNGASVTNLRVGSIHTVNTGGFLGNLDEIRISRGVARYTGNFTPSSQALTYP